ncbi:hypothetical protein NKH77_23465 [Streptomyces sp. M19]
MIRPDGTEETWEYDGEGNCTRHTDPNGASTGYTYTHFDLLAARHEPDGTHHEFHYDASLRLTGVVNPQGLSWSYVYDSAGRLIAETDFDGRTQRYEHDATGRLSTRVTAAGDSIRFQRDELGRVVAKSSGGTTTTYAYDAAGSLIRAAGPDTVLTRRYDGQGQLVAETVDGRVMTYTYDALGRRTGRTTPSGVTSTWTYDAAGRRTALTTSGRTLTFVRDAAGREASRHIGDAVIVTSDFDTLGRTTGQEVTGPNGRRVQRRAYRYRADDGLIGISDSEDGDRDIALDVMGRVTAVQAQGWAETYAYDEFGNQTHASWPATVPGEEANGSRSYTGTRLDASGRVRYQHDPAGRVTLRRKKYLSRAPRTWRYSWDAENRLTQVLTPDGVTWRHTYDPLGRRTGKQRLGADGETVVERVDFAWDHTTLVEQTTRTPGTTRPAVTLSWEYHGRRP